MLVRPFARTTLFLLSALAGCGPLTGGGAHRCVGKCGDAGTMMLTDGGADFAGSTATLSSVTITPANQVLNLSLGSTQTIAYQAIGTYSDSSQRPVSGSWSLVDTSIGAIDSVGGSFTANGVVGGSTQVQFMPPGGSTVIHVGRRQPVEHAPAVPHAGARSRVAVHRGRRAGHRRDRTSQHRLPARSRALSAEHQCALGTVDHRQRLDHRRRRRLVSADLLQAEHHRRAVRTKCSGFQFCRRAARRGFLAHRRDRPGGERHFGDRSPRRGRQARRRRHAHSSVVRHR